MRLYRTLPAIVALSLTVGVTSAQAFSTNEFVTFSQVAWGDDGNVAANIIVANFDTVYAPTNDVLEIGIPGSAGFSLTFDQGSSVIAYLPANGAPAALNADLNDPLTSASGVFGGEVLALRINVDFSDADVITHPAGVAFGDLILTGLTGTQASMNGLTVREFQSDANILLGGGAVASLSILDADILTNELNMAFNGGPVSTFAEDNLELPPSATPLPATLPLFATGIGGLGLLVWRRKRKAQAVG